MTHPEIPGGAEESTNTMLLKRADVIDGSRRNLAKLAHSVSQDDPSVRKLQHMLSVD